jgi:hypothetical protein
MNHYEGEKAKKKIVAEVFFFSPSFSPFQSKQQQPPSRDPLVCCTSRVVKKGEKKAALWTNSHPGGGVERYTRTHTTLSSRGLCGTRLDRLVALHLGDVPSHQPSSQRLGIRLGKGDGRFRLQRCPPSFRLGVGGSRGARRGGRLAVAGGCATFGQGFPCAGYGVEVACCCGLGCSGAYCCVCCSRRRW